MGEHLNYCLDCGVDTYEINEYYTVHDELWLLCHPEDYGMLCIGCLEKRLGRRLDYRDFIDAPINNGFFEQSERLRERLRHG